jgi:error-prone DNA polymerase
MERQRRAVMAARLIVIEGEIQRSKEGVVHLMAKHVYDRTAMLDHLSESTEQGSTVAPQRIRGHPRNARVLPKSRDFH